MAGGRVVAGGSPFSVLRLTDKGSDAFAREDGRIMRVLAHRGITHPKPSRHRPTPLPTLVVPVHDDAIRLERLLELLAADDSVGPVIVVDDASSPAVPHADVRFEDNRGPAAARNAARSLLRPEAAVVAFVDADTEPAPGWLDVLVSHLDDPAVGAVAPRVVASHGGGAIGCYEELHSPLDLGPEPGLVGSGRRISYVPTAALVCRREALDSVGWFDETLRQGEDVDLLRRLGEAGWLVRYEPSVQVRHAVRGGLRDFAGQRFAYGTSAAEIDRRHPGTVAPLQLSLYEVPFVGAALALTLGPKRCRSGAATLGATALLVLYRWIAAELRRLGVGAQEARSEAMMLTWRSALGAVLGFLHAIRRSWWPLVVLAARRSPASRRLVVLLAVSQASRRPLPRSVPAAALGLVDDAAYALGVWWGCAKRRSLKALLPAVRPLRRTRRDPRAG